MSKTPLRVTVFGAGVVGLSTAISFQTRSTPSRPIEVRLVALSTPENPNADPMYTSPKAAANWRSFADADDVKQQNIDADTFKILWQLAILQDRNPDVKTYVRRVWSYEAYPGKDEEPWFKDFVPNYSLIDDSKMPPERTFGYQYESICFDVDGYLKWLGRTFVRLGGKMLAGVKVGHLNELVNGLGWDGYAPDILALCPGMGALYLPGLEDKKVFPTRGQTVLVKAPTVRDCWVTVAPGAGFSYVMPRFNGEGHVILGGTAQAGNFELKPDLDIAAQISERCKNLEPILKEQGYELVEHRVGLRPSRIGGIRLETFTAPARSGKQVTVTTNYGHGGYGWQSSWGSAKVAVDLVLGPSTGADERELKVLGIPEVWKALRQSIQTEEAAKGRTKL